MASARDESNPYGGGLGAGGKFKKRPFRRTTPYDRPPTAIRNPNGTGNRNGWLSKLVAPAQRLITSSAHRLFASVFRKRLTHAPPPPPPPEPLDSAEAKQEAKENSPAGTSTDPFVVERAAMECENPINHTDEGGVDELEEILKHKTFTRSEIDRLTSLLHSRTVDFSGGNEEMGSNVKPVVSHDKKEKLPEILVRDNGTENHLVSTPVVCSTVPDEDVASPAELAKAYMGSRPPKVSVSMLGSQNQGPMGDSALVSNKNFPSRSPITSLVPRSSHAGSFGNGFATPRSGQVGSSGNGFATPRSGQVGSPGYGLATPRSLGRSAIYRMARTPYSRVNSAVVLKGAGTASGAFGGPSTSSAQSAWDQHRISGSRQEVLKRRSSLLDNDIGSTGPIRRIRQKSNILSSKKSNFPVSVNPPSIDVAGTSSSGLDALAENGDISTPGTSRTSVPSKSSETASKIFQQLDKLVSPGEKSRSIHGQTHKSLENADSSKCLENMHDSDKSSGFNTALTDVQDSMSYKPDKAKGNGSTMSVVLPDKSLKSVPAMNGVDTGSLMKDTSEPNVKAADSTVIKSAIQLPQQKRWAFQMSANEDSLDLDDDEYPNGATAAEAISVEKPSSLSEFKSITSSAFNLKPDLRTSDGSAVVENNAGITFPVSKVAASSVPATLLASQSTSTAKEDATTEEPKAASMLSFGEKVASAKQSDAGTSIFGFAPANVIGTSSASGSSGVKLTASSDTKQENSNSFATTATCTTNYLSDKTDKNNTSTSVGSIFKFDSSKNSSTLNNGSLASSPFSFSLPTSQILNNGQSSSGGSTNYMSTNGNTFGAATASTTANVLVNSTSSPSTEASVSSFTAAPVFKFASSGNPSTSVSTLSATSGEATEAKTGNVASGLFGSNAFTSSGSNIFGGSSSVTGTSSTFGHATGIVTTSENSKFSDPSSNITNSRSGFFNSTSSTVTNTGSGIFGGTSANTEKGSSIFGGTSSSIANTGSSVFSTTTSITGTGTGSSIFGFSAPAASGSTTQSFNPFSAVNTQPFAAGTGFGTSTQSSTPIQFSSSASSLSVGMSSGATFGMSSSSSETNSLSTASGISSGSFGSNWQAPKSPIFGSSSSGFSFGSSASVTAPSSTPALFGSSTSASNSIFSFTSAPVATPSQPLFGNTSPGLVFGSTPSSNNDQMQDSMAEDTIQASPTIPTFGQPAFSPPASGFSVGATNASGATSFQFGAQPSMATPQSPSLFQASSSLEFGAGGNFSMGSGGGDKSGRKFVKVRRRQPKK